jgi:hypothetical protein
VTAGGGQALAADDETRAIDQALRMFVTSTEGEGTSIILRLPVSA